MHGAWVLASSLEAAAWLEWAAPPECTSSVAVVERVEALVAVPRDTAFLARGRVTRSERSARLRLEIVRNGIADVRTIDAPQCEELERAAAVLIAVAIDPEAALRAPSEGDAGAKVPTPSATNAGAGVQTPSGAGTTSQTSSAADAEVTPATAPAVESSSAGGEAGTELDTRAQDERNPRRPQTRPREDEASSKRSRAGRPRTRAAPPFATAMVGGNALWGPLPAGGAGVSLGASIVSPWVRGSLLLHGAWGFQPAAVDIGAIRMALWVAQLAACFRARTGRSEFPVCASPEIGFNHAQTQDPAVLRDGTGLWVAALAGVGWIWPVDAPAALRLGADVGGVLYRKTYEAGDMSLFDPAPWVVRVHVGVEIALRRTRANGSSTRRR